MCIRSHAVGVIEITNDDDYGDYSNLAIAKQTQMMHSVKAFGLTASHTLGQKFCQHKHIN